MTDKKHRRIRKTIIILAILLAVSLAALCGVLIYRYLTDSTPTIVQVPDNIITDSSSPSSDISEDSSDANMSVSSDVVSSGSAESQKTAPVLSFNSSIYGENLPFNVSNMFPGDVYSQYYCLRVSFEDTVTINFDTEFVQKYGKLSEVLYICVRMPGNNTPLYEGLMRDMPVLEHTLYSEKEVTRDVYYIIDVYLPTSVGNEYQNSSLVADFHWFVTETENLKPSPPMGGDGFSVYPWIFLAVFSLCGLIFLCPQRREEEKDAK